MNIEIKTLTTWVDGITTYRGLNKDILQSMWAHEKCIVSMRGEKSYGVDFSDALSTLHSNPPGEVLVLFIAQDIDVPLYKLMSYSLVKGEQTRPIAKNEMFYTPKGAKELQNWIERLNGSERKVAYTVWMMATNMLSELGAVFRVDNAENDKQD